MCVRHLRGIYAYLAGESPMELETVRDNARRRALQGVPLAALLHSYRVGTLFIWETFVTAADERVQAVLLESVSELWLGLEDYSEAVRSTYHEVEAERELRVRRDRDLLFDALLGADHARILESADALGLPQQGRFHVLAAETAAEPRLPGHAVWRELPGERLAVVSVPVPRTIAPAARPASTAPAARPASTAPAVRPASTAPAVRPASTAPAAARPAVPPPGGPSPAAPRRTRSWPTRRPAGSGSARRTRRSRRPPPRCAWPGSRWPPSRPARTGSAGTATARSPPWSPAARRRPATWPGGSSPGFWSCPARIGPRCSAPRGRGSRRAVRRRARPRRCSATATPCATG
nr:hypothetical protein GCM10020093_053750 [Planobispora longispora]